MFDTVIRNGRLIDPKSNTNCDLHIAIKDGKVAKIGAEISEKGTNEIDATGLYVVPGLIDIHTHLFEHATVLGISPDKFCLARGVTTAIDGGSSGCMTFNGLRKFICEASRTRVLAFLNIACHGMAGAGCSGEEFGVGGENDHLNALKLNACINCIEANRDLIVGVKVRLDVNITNNGRNEFEAFSRARAAAAATKTPLMVHHTNSGIELTSSDEVSVSCPGSLRRGDIYTHTFHGHKSSIYDAKTKSIYSGVVQSQARDGVLFDVGHGQGSFDWTVAEAGAQQGFWPDLISTDLHSGNVEGSAKDLCHVMSKFLALGMSFEQIIGAVTEAPAKAINREAELGSLQVGREADITLLKIVPAEFTAEDSFGVGRCLKRAIAPIRVWRAGVEFPIEPRDLEKEVVGRL